MDATNVGEFNIQMGWIFMVFGILTGSIIGCWSFAGPFPTPPGHKNYTDLPRRMTRLAHIALFMLPLISIVIGHHIDNLPFSESTKWFAAYCWVVCMIGVPTFLYAGALYNPLKYLEIIPVSAGTITLVLMSWGHLQLLMN